MEQMSSDFRKQKKPLINNLRNYVRGIISADELKTEEPFIKDIWEKKNLGESLVSFNFKYDEYEEMTGLYYEDIIFFRCLFTSSGCEYVGLYEVESDFDDGYSVWNQANMKNLQKLGKIAEFIIPNLDFAESFAEPDRKYVKELNYLLKTNFKSETADIIENYHYFFNEMLENSMRKDIGEELKELSNSSGFWFTKGFDDGFITPARLIMKIRELNFDGDLKDLVRISIGGIFNHAWSEIDVYNYEDFSLFDNKNYNERLSQFLDVIIDKIKEYKN